MKTNMFEKYMANWAKNWKKENLSEDVCKLISGANFNLYYGPGGTDEDFPGFVSACETISKELKELPWTLYVDLETGYDSTDLPEFETCGTCDGEGTVGDDDPTHEQVRSEKCPDCNGLGGFEPSCDWYHVEKKELIKYIVGKELADHIR